MRLTSRNRADGRVSASVYRHPPRSFSDPRVTRESSRFGDGISGRHLARATGLGGPAAAATGPGRRLQRPRGWSLSTSDAAAIEQGAQTCRCGVAVPLGGDSRMSYPRTRPGAVPTPLDEWPPGRCTPVEGAVTDARICVETFPSPGTLQSPRIGVPLAKRARARPSC
jgi:hypothetical protein